MVAVIDKVAFGDHAIFLLGVGGDISGKVPLLQQFTKGALAVTGVPSQRHRHQRQPFQQIGNRF